VLSEGQSTSAQFDVFDCGVTICKSAILDVVRRPIFFQVTSFRKCSLLPSSDERDKNREPYSVWSLCTAALKSRTSSPSNLVLDYSCVSRYILPVIYLFPRCRFCHIHRGCYKPAYHTSMLKTPYLISFSVMNSRVCPDIT
jgi:hypothetical protein